MDINKMLKDLKIEEDSDTPNYQYVSVFKNPLELPITEIHMERSFREIRRNVPNDCDVLSLSAKELEKLYWEKKIEIIPALDKRWLPKCKLFKYEPYLFTLSQEENLQFLINNTQFLESLHYLLTCNFHQFWCTILFEPSAALTIRSFILNPITPYQAKYLLNEYVDMYKVIFRSFLQVFERLLRFYESEYEYMPSEYGLQQLIDKKLLNLPIVISLAYLYKNSNLEFVNRVTSLYFNDTSQLDFQIKEIEEMISQSLIVLEMVGGYVCGFTDDAVIVPISLEKRPPVFSLQWVYSVVCYLLDTLSTLNVLFQFNKPTVEIALNKHLPFRLPYIYVSVYKELYEMLDNREELKTQKDLSEIVFDLINVGRNEFVDVFHVFISYCLDETLKHMGDTKKQEHIVETYLKLLTTALEDEYFICDYNIRHNVATLNEMFESCFPVDSTRTDFIVACINRLSRQKKLEQLSKINRQTVEAVFKQFEPPVMAKEVEPEPKAPASNNSTDNNDIEVEEKIQSILDMFPHLGDGFVYQCLEVYNFNSDQVINAVLEENLSPNLYDLPMDMIRIPPEPEPEQPILAYRGKKPTYDDALSMLNDKTEKKAIKTLVLEGIQYNYDHMYDDEYDDRYDDDVPINVADNPLSEEVPATFNPNHEDLASDTSYSSEDEYDEEGKPLSKAAVNGRGTLDKSKIPFCEDPAVIRERREAKFRGRGRPGPSTRPAANVVGKPKGQGQDKNVLLNRQKKNTNKSTRANHNRKGGAAFKRNKGMIPS